MASNQGNGQATVPGLHLFDGLIHAYTSAWRKYADTLNEVWGDVTASDAGQSDWSSGFSKLMQVWSDNLRDLSSAYTGLVPGYGRDQTPVLVFVLDQVANASARTQSVTLPPGCDFTNVKFTELKSLSGEVLLPGKLNVSFNPDTRCLDVAVKDLVANDPKIGHFMSIVYDNVSPAPRRALCVVLVSFPERLVAQP